MHPPCPLALGVIENGFQDCVGDGKFMHTQLVCTTGRDCPARADRYGRPLLQELLYCLTNCASQLALGLSGNGPERNGAADGKFHQARVDAR